MSRVTVPEMTVSVVVNENSLAAGHGVVIEAKAATTPGPSDPGQGEVGVDDDDRFVPEDERIYVGSPAAGDAVFGVLQKGGDRGAQVPAKIVGVSDVVLSKVNTAVAVGAVLQPTASGAFTARVATNPVAAYALEAITGGNRNVDPAEDRTIRAFLISGSAVD